MPTNPIQRKTRNAFLSGMLIMLLVAIAVGVVLYLSFFNQTMTEIQEKQEGGIAEVYRVTSTIKSGEKIQIGKLEQVEMYVEDLPVDYIGPAANLSNYTSKIDLQAGTILSNSLLTKEQQIADTTRLLEYNMITLPSTLSVGDYVDIRLTMPSGQNYIVLSKKQIVNLQNTTVSFYLTEDEILMMSSAIIESYVMKASDLAAVQYVEAGLQEAVIPTYSVNPEVYKLIERDGNIKDYAKINDSYNSELRAIMDQELSQYSAAGLTNVEQGMTEQKEKAMELYLSGLAGY